VLASVETTHRVRFLALVNYVCEIERRTQPVLARAIRAANRPGLFWAKLGRIAMFDKSRWVCQAKPGAYDWP
jgi:hypothetical protein